MKTLRWVVITTMFVANCAKSSPTETKAEIAAQKACADNPACDGIVRPPDPAAAAAQIDRARQDVETQFPSSRVPWSKTPQIRYEACWFWVPDSNFGPTCAAGCTLFDENTIVISTMEPDRTLPLIYWEARNYYYILSGHADLAS